MIKDSTLFCIMLSTWIAENCSQMMLEANSVCFNVAGLFECSMILCTTRLHGIQLVTLLQVTTLMVTMWLMGLRTNCYL